MRNFIERWHSILASKDFLEIPNLLHEDVIFQSPVVHTPQVGRQVTSLYLSSAIKVLGNNSFHYVKSLQQNRDCVLEFNTNVQGIEVNGIDLITLDDAGLITEFKVFIRPLKAILLIKDLMAKTIQSEIERIQEMRS